MRENKDRVLKNHASYLCLITGREMESKGYDYQILFSFNDSDSCYDEPSFLGVANGEKCSFEQFKQLRINQRIKELEALKAKVTDERFFMENDEILPTYFLLENNLKKYRRRRPGNPDVIKFVEYQKEHPEIHSPERHYDIKYFGLTVDTYPKEIIDNVVLRTRFIDIEEDATIERRKQMNEYVLSQELDPHNVSCYLKYFLFDNIESDFRYTRDKLEEFLKKYPEIHLFNISFDGDQKLFKKLDFEIEETSLADFNLDEYINMDSNVLYRFRA